MSQLSQNSEPAERLRGCKFAEKFASEVAVTKNAGVINGAPQFAERTGGTFDGAADYIEYTTEIRFFGNASGNIGLTILLEFYPDFTPTDNAQTVFCDLRGASNVQIEKENNAANNILQFGLGGAWLIQVAQANYENFWVQNGRNQIVFVASSGDQRAYLNGNEIGNAAGALAVDDVYTLAYAGANNAGARFYDGRITELKVFEATIEAQEVDDWWTGATYRYDELCQIHLPMTMATHDPVNTQTLDVSGNERHCVFQTAPTKLPNRGYSFLAASTQWMICPEVAAPLNTVSYCIATPEDYWPGNLVITNALGSLQNGGASLVRLGALGGLVTPTVILGSAAGFASYSQTIVPVGLTHLVFRIDPASLRYTIYINGVAGVSVQFLGGLVAWNPYRLYLGKRQDAAQYFTGNIHQVRSFHVSLTPLQIADIYIRDIKSVQVA
jgi:hypothetical protein